MNSRSATPPLTGPSLTIGLGLFTGQAPDRYGDPPYASAIDLAVAAEANGFDAFWVSEHHGLPDGYLPSPLLLLGAVATHTRSLTLGTGLAIAPLYHPIRLAEDAAVVDRLSGGRLVLGLGMGYVEHEYQTFGVDRSQRGEHMEDLVGLLRTAWRGEPFDWSGPALKGAGLNVTPTPVRGSVPVWLGGYSARAVQRAVRAGRRLPRWQRRSGRHWPSVGCGL